MNPLKQFFARKIKERPRQGTSRFVYMREKPDFDQVEGIHQLQQIYVWVFHEDKQIATECAMAIHRILNTQKGVKNKTIYNSLKYIELIPKDLLTFCDFVPEVRDSLFCMASMNNSGYIREDALIYLTEFSSKSSFFYILFRLSDWVPSIRTRAENAVRQLISDQEPAYLIRHHKLINWLLQVQRNDLKAIHAEIINYIFSSESIARLTEQIVEQDEGTRFFLYKSLISRNQMNERLYEKALADSSALIRFLAARNLSLTERPKVLPKLLKDRNQKLRLYALQQLGPEQAAQNKALVISLLDDPASTIRSLARSLLTDLVREDFHKMYLERLDIRPTRGSIIGLSEVGSKTDLDQLRNFLNAELSSHRAAALLAFANLDYPEARTLAFQYLSDPSNKVKRTSANLISREISAQDLEALRTLYESSTISTRIVLLRLMAQVGGWSIAGDFLKAMTDSSEKVKQLAMQLFKSWYVYSMRLATQLSDGDQTYVMEQYESISHFLSDLPSDVKKKVKEIPFIFKRS